MHRRAGAAINPWSNDNRGADRPGEERLKPDVGGLGPELPPCTQAALFPTSEDRRYNREGRRGGTGILSVHSLFLFLAPFANQMEMTEAVKPPVLKCFYSLLNLNAFADEKCNK